nr:putative late blight resistance protein homolog R1A-4 [Coffea arabica]
MEFLTKLVKKADRSPTNAVNFLLMELGDWWNLSESQDEDEKDAHKQIQILKVELRLLRTFLIYVGIWNDLHKDVGLLLQSLVQDLEAAFMEASTDFRSPPAYEIQRSVEYLYPVISKWQQKFKLFRPLIKAAYDYVSSKQELCSFQCQSPLVSYSPLSNYVPWNEFSGSLLDNLVDLSREDTFHVHIKPHIQVMAKMIGNLRGFMAVENRNANQQEYRHLLAHFGAILVQTAYISYVCWIDGLDENMKNEIIPKLVDLLKKLKPNASQVTRICFKLLEDHKYNCEEFVRFLIPQKNQLLTLQKGLKYLIMLVIQPPSFYTDNDVKLLSMDIIEMVSELGSFSYLFHAKETVADLAKDAYPLLFRLLEKMERLNAELFLTELLQPGIVEKSFVKNRINSFHDGLSFLQIFLGDDGREIPQPIWKNIGSLARNAGNVYLAFLRKSVTKDKVTFELLKSLERIKLFKMEILLHELLNSRPNMTVDVQNQIQTLYKGLTVLRTFLMGPLEEDGKLILAHVELVVKHVISVIYSVAAKKVTEDMATNLVLLLPELVEKIEPVNAGIKEIYLRARSSFKSCFPKPEGVGFMDFLIGNLMELLNSKAKSIGSLKYPIHIVHREMGFLRSILCNIREKWTQHLDIKCLVSHIIQVAYEVEYLVDSLVVRGGVLWYHALWVTDLIEDIRLLKIKASEISMKTCGINISNGPEALRKVTSPAKIPKIDEEVIDLADQNKIMIDRLTRGSRQQDVVSIVGMPGLGKTTLARKVYNDPSVIFHFHIRAWCSVSQVYCKRDLLLEMLGGIMDITDSILEMSDDDLDLELYQCLKRKRYLIVMDDIWSTEPWHDLERTFPNDENGSRILVTSRLPDVALEIKADRIPHRLRLLSHDESWELLQKKLFKTRDCQVELVTVGNQIAKSCQGLPLAIVAVSGILERTEMTLDSWKKVSESLCSRIASDPQTRCMEILELSYKHLPDYLKPCFLYLGAFLENKEIPVRKLTWLWVAEGFVRSTASKRVEDLAEEYLKDLIGRSLVIASKSRSNGGVKTCCVHDLLRTLCLLRCHEENFLHSVTGHNFFFDASYDDSDYGVDPDYHPTNCTTYAKRRLSICSKRNHFIMSRPGGPHVRSLLYSASSDLYPRCPYNISFIFENFKLLRVLDLECINMGNSFFSGIELLAHLRYLALCGDIDYIPASIANLWNLETLIVKGLKGKVLLPHTIWSMEKLRHLHVYSNAVFNMQDNETEKATQLGNLDSLSTPSLSFGKHTENIMRRFLKLRRLRCLFSESRVDVGNSNQFPVLNCLTELESLKILCSGRIAHPFKFDFPLKLKKLTLSKFRLPWDCILEVGRLPNLEVLKLLSRAFEGKVWDMKEGQFPKLNFLKLDTLNLAQWNATSDDFPNLQHLVLRNCRQLEEVPSGLGDVPTLEIIEVQLCRQSAEESVRRIEEEQHMMGNDDLKVLINRSEWDF